MVRQQDLLEAARAAVATARKHGAKHAAATASKQRDVSVDWRDGKLEKIHEATARGLAVELYVDGRFGVFSTSDLRPEALDAFLARSVAMTRMLEADPHRMLPEPAYYEGRSVADLELTDPALARLQPADRLKLAQAIEGAARQVRGAQAIISVTSSVSDTAHESARVASNGFEGRAAGTQVFLSGDVSVKDPSGRKPEEGHFAGGRFLGGLPAAAAIGREAAERAIGRIGAKKGTSGQMKVAVDARVAGRLLRFFLGAMTGASLQQKQSFLEGKLEQKVGSELLSCDDEPLLPRGLASRHYDAEGMTARKRPVLTGGVLRTYFIDTYYGRKLGMVPTTRSPSNLVFALGSKGRDALLSDMRDGFYVTSFIGGNSNGTTGDFSLGAGGFLVRKGAIAEPVAEMNVSGNHLQLWKHLVAIGNDPWPYSAARTPTMVFDGVAVAGT